MTKLVQSPDINMNDLKFSAFSKNRVWGQRRGRIDDLVQGVQMLFGEDNLETLRRVW